jgi:hypothetical protein
MVTRHPWRTFPTLINLARGRLALAAAALLSLLGGFIAAAIVDQQPSRWIRAETDPAERGQQVDAVPEQSFSTAADLLSPKPLMNPVPSLGPGRADPSVLRAALDAAVSSPSDKNDIERWMHRP